MKNLPYFLLFCCITVSTFAQQDTIYLENTGKINKITTANKMNWPVALKKGDSITIKYSPSVPNDLFPIKSNLKRESNQWG
jgi:hypothetical protein